MAFLFANNINTTLAAAATSTQTTLSLTSTVGIPTTIPSGDYFAMTLNDAATRSVFEVVYVTAISGSNVTIVRGQEGTSANSWLAGDYIYGALTAGELLAFANVAGSSTQPFAVAPASASAPQNAPQFGQMFDLQSPSASGSITLSALRTVVIPSATVAITLMMEPGITAGQWCEIVGTSYGVTVQSNVSSGSPYFAMPDGSVPYSFTLSSAGASLVLIWDGTNWRVQSIGQTIVAAATESNQATPLSQILSGGLSPTFSNLAASTGVFSNFAFYTSSTTFTVPAGVTKILAVVTGGGGGGSDCSASFPPSSTTDASGGGGGAGGTAIGVYSVTPGAQITITVGTGGNSENNGGSSSFGSFCSATGGGGANFSAAASSAGGSPGVGAGGQVNLYGGYGSDGQGSSTAFAGNGGSSYWGGGGRAASGGGQSASAIGAGGGGAYNSTSGPGGPGQDGCVLLRW